MDSTTKESTMDPEINEPEQGLSAAEQARRLLLQEAQERRNKCAYEVERTLKSYGCTIEPQLIMTPRGHQFKMQVTLDPGTDIPDQDVNP